MLALAMKPKAVETPRYNHLLELLDGAASLRTAIAQAEMALAAPDLGEDDRTLFASVLEASRERLTRVDAVLRHRGAEGIESLVTGDTDPDPEWEAADLREAARAAREGSDTAERRAARAIDRIGRSLKTGAADDIDPFLQHPSALLRASAMKVLVAHWRLRGYTDRVLWALACDEDSDCRRAAALCLGSLYQGTKDLTMGRELVTTLTRAGEPEDVQWASYHALLDVDGFRQDKRPLPTDPFDPTRDVDPRILSRYTTR